MSEQLRPVQFWYLTFSQGTSHKFYEVAVLADGRTYRRWGRINATGQAQCENHKSVEDAEVQANALVYQKRDKGYHLEHHGTFSTDYEKFRYHADIDVMMLLRRQFERAVSLGSLTADQAVDALGSMMKQVTTFLEASKDVSTEDLINDWASLNESWKKVTDEYETVDAAVGIARSAVQQRLQNLETT